jgi:hypothetical protein
MFMNMRQAEVALLHGSGLKIIENEVRPSLETLRVASAGERLIRAGKVEKLVLSGHGPVPDDSPTTEAGIMADILIRGGINHRYMELDEISTSTLGNWVQSADIIEELGDTVIGVGRRLQEPRSRMLGSFVAGKRPVSFEVVGYEGIAEETRLKTLLDLGREALLLSFSAAFIIQNKNTPFIQLEGAYDEMKKSFGLQGLKGQGRRAA